MTSNERRTRLDIALVENNLVPSRSRARDLILRGEVLVDGIVANKVAMTVTDTHRLSLAAGAGDYVSRGHLKLKAALDHFQFDPNGRIALDIGASTGGFTELLVRRGAVKVYAVENGHDQLHPSLLNDARVVSMEHYDARRLTAADVPEPVEAIVADVSFISLTKVLPAALALSVRGAWLVALIKPQFEGDGATVSRAGIVTKPDDQEAAVDRVATWLGQQPDWHIRGVIPSPILGGDGNQEFLIGAERAGQN